MGFGFFPLIASLARALVLALLFVVVIGFIFWLFTRSGWRLTRAVQTTAPPPSTETSTENENQDTGAKP